MWVVGTCSHICTTTYCNLHNTNISRYQLLCTLAPAGLTARYSAVAFFTEKVNEPYIRNHKRKKFGAAGNSLQS